MSFIDRLKAARLSKGLTQEYLAREIGVAKSTYTGYEKGNSEPSMLMLQRLMRVLEVDANYLFQDMMTVREDTRATPEEMEKLIKRYRRLDAHGKEMADVVLERETARLEQELFLRQQAELARQVAEAQEEPAPIRYIRHYLVPAAAGYASPIQGEDYELIEAGSDVPSNADFCVTIDGDSMMPYLKNGQLVYVQRDASLEDFDVGIFYYDGDVYCKQICMDFVNNVYLLSANPKRQDANILISKDAASTLVCYGKVILPHKLPQPRY